MKCLPRTMFEYMRNKIMGWQISQPDIIGMDTLFLGEKKQRRTSTGGTAVSNIIFSLLVFSVDWMLRKETQVIIITVS